MKSIIIVAYFLSLILCWCGPQKQNCDNLPQVSIPQFVSSQTNAFTVGHKWWYKNDLNQYDSLEVIEINDYNNCWDDKYLLEGKEIRFNKDLAKININMDDTDLGNINNSIKFGNQNWNLQPYDNGVGLGIITTNYYPTYLYNGKNYTNVLSSNKLHFTIAQDSGIINFSENGIDTFKLIKKNF